MIVGTNPSNQALPLKPGYALVYSWNRHQILARLEGNQAYDAFGASVARLRDFNGDGIAEIMIGAPRTSSRRIFNHGALYIYSGATFELLNVLAELHPERFFGWSVAEIGNVANLGITGIVVGSPGLPKNISGVIPQGAAWAFRDPQELGTPGGGQSNSKPTE